MDLVFRQQTLQFRPPLEEIRAQYYKELKKFIQFPGQCKGLSGNASAFFRPMIDRNAGGLLVVYRKAEELFARLQRVPAEFAEHVILGQVNIGQLVLNNVTEMGHFEENFKALKNKGRDAEKLPVLVEVDCICVSTTPVKLAIDDQIQHLFDLLVSTLRKAVDYHSSEISSFIDKGTEILTSRPQSIDEISTVNEKRLLLVNEKKAIQTLFDDIEGKNRLLRSVAGESRDIAKLTTRWDKFELMVDGFSLMIKEQVDVLKVGLAGRITTFRGSIQKFTSRWAALKPTDVSKLSREAAMAVVTALKERRSELNELLAQNTAVQRDCVNFSMEVPVFDSLVQVCADIGATEALWLLFDEFNSQVSAIADEEWISLRDHIFDFSDLLDKWTTRLKTFPANMITIRIQNDVDKYHDFVPLLKYIRGEGFTADHWAELLAIGNIAAKTIDKLPFAAFLNQHDVLLQEAEKVKAIFARAQGEISIRQALSELDTWGATERFSLTDFKDSKNSMCKIIKDWKELLNKVGDNQGLLQSLKDSPYYKIFADPCTLWETRLADLDEYLGHLKIIQRKWVYLEPIFGRGALPKEQGRFQQVSDDYRGIMEKIIQDNRVVKFVDGSGLRGRLVAVADQLARCQKSLNEYLEEKRSLFPRFYFIGDDDLLEILGQATDAGVIQTHLKKLFAGIYSVVFNSKKTQITAMCSQEGEAAKLCDPVTITGNVEEWLAALAVSMIKSLQGMLLNCVKGTTGVDVNQFPSQILCVTEQVTFTTRCEKSLCEGNLPVLKKQLVAQLEAYTTNDSTVDTVDVSVVWELKLKALILDVIHMIEVVDLLVEKKIVSLNDWYWQKQIRSYIINGICSVQMCNMPFEYTYEYQGNAPKLVHTPLTDKCYLTLTQGMNLGFGGNPYGPAGTGKTESVKALGNLMGRQVLVFNCDEGLDVKSIGRIFIGLVKCGAWGCFDEFNRLEESVLSAVSMQIQIIQAALKSKTSTVELLGRVVNINPNSGIFITMNPAGKGYGGRSKLPDNLKQLFRPVAMSEPQQDLITEVILLSEGYKSAKDLGRKLVTLFTLSKQLLSAQQHYDWGLRALKTVLRAGGRLLKMRLKVPNADTVTAAIESQILVQAIRVNTLSKLTFADSVQFDALVMDLFPGVAIVDIVYPELLAAIKEAYIELKLIFMESQVKKMLEFYEQACQRMGVVVVGPSGSGKSTLWRILSRALNKINQPLKYHIMNPKAMPRHQLLGHIDMDTREWFDGVLTHRARQVVKDQNDNATWVICDGDIDPEWIESLNSVLDDNRLLTMPNGERIQFGPNCNFIFESNDLTCASPATISRMGMIFLSEEDLDVKILVQAWLLTCPEKTRGLLADWMQEFFFKGLAWVLAQPDTKLVQSRVGVARNGLAQLGTVETKPAFACALVRGLGGGLTGPAREKFAKEVFVWSRLTLPASARGPVDVFCDPHGQLSAFLPQQSNAFSPADLLNEPLVLIKRVQQALAALRPLFVRRESFILVGPEGCGKLNLVNMCLRETKGTAVARVFCNAQTMPSDVCQKLQQMCMVTNSNMGRVYRPRDAERLVLYLKDLNLSKPDKWGTSSLVSFLQQLITYNGFYDTDLEWVAIENIQVVISLNPPTSMGRHVLSSRITSILRVYTMDYPDAQELTDIYCAFLQPILTAKLPHGDQYTTPKFVSRLAGVCVTLYERLRQVFNRSEFNHYLFSPRYLSEWALTLLRYEMAGENFLHVFVYEVN